ncbi:hypothetical protein Hanom_Chr06g00479171 [Helianthus anomalus]
MILTLVDFGWFGVTQYSGTISYVCFLWRLPLHHRTTSGLVSFRENGVDHHRPMVAFFSQCSKAFHAIVLIASWCIWNMRNDVIFKRKEVSLSKVIEDTKTLGFLWVKGRSRDGEITWERWRTFDVF